MNITTKFREIISIYEKKSYRPIGTFNQPISSGAVEKIEHLLDEKLPSEIKELYSFANGQSNQGNGVFFGEWFCSSDEIIQSLEFSRTLIKPEIKTIANPKESENLLQQIVSFFTEKVSKYKSSRSQKLWHKVKFTCSPHSVEGPYLYATEDTPASEKEVIHIDFEEMSETFELVRNLHELEKSTYNWDELKFVVYLNGTYEVERSMYDFDDTIPFTSTPNNAIKKKYFHYKWLPIFSDQGGNYIGIDLDPDIHGSKGQVINFGRDEENMFVFAESLEDLFDKILVELNMAETRLLRSEIHLHEVLIELIKDGRLK